MAEAKVGVTSVKKSKSHKISEVKSLDAKTFVRIQDTLSKQDARIKILQCYNKAKDKTIKAERAQITCLTNEVKKLMTQNERLKTESFITEGSSTVSSVPTPAAAFSAEHEDSVDYRERCRRLERILSYGSEDIGERLDREELERIVDRQTAELNRKTRFINDLKKTIENDYAGTDKAIILELRKKNDRLQKLNQQKVDLLTEHKAMIDEMDKTILEQATSTVTSGSGPSPAFGFISVPICEKCSNDEAEVQILRDTVLAQQMEMEELQLIRQDLEEEKIRARDTSDNKLCLLQSIHNDLKRKYDVQIQSLQLAPATPATPSLCASNFSAQSATSITSSTMLSDSHRYIARCDPCNQQFSSSELLQDHKRLGKCKA